MESKFIDKQKMFRVTKKTSLGVAMGLIPVFFNRNGKIIYTIIRLPLYIRILFGLLYLSSSFIKNKETKEFFKLNFGYAFFISVFFDLIYSYTLVFDLIYIRQILIIFLISLILGAYVYSYLTEEEEIN